ncbi:hypothetical protein TNCV_1101851 [Trichonephila clavipes]|nr:hypothetical protein TNCV_1101851 [Trichonephila clavipes]
MVQKGFVNSAYRGKRRVLERNYSKTIEKFYFKCVLPEILDGRAPRNMPLREPLYVEESSRSKKQKMIDIDGDRFNSCQVIYSQFGLAIHQARRRFVEWVRNEIAVVPDFHKRILFSDEAHFWLNGYVNKQNCCIWSEANPQVYVETPLHPEKLTVWCALWAGGILLQKR